MDGRAEIAHGLSVVPARHAGAGAAPRRAAVSVHGKDFPALGAACARGSGALPRAAAPQRSTAAGDGGGAESHRPSGPGNADAARAARVYRSTATATGGDRRRDHRRVFFCPASGGNSKAGHGRCLSRRRFRLRMPLTLQQPTSQRRAKRGEKPAVAAKWSLVADVGGRAKEINVTRPKAFSRGSAELLPEGRDTSAATAPERSTARRDRPHRHRLLGTSP